MIKAIITFVIGNSFWDFLIDILGSPQEVIEIAILLVMILFAFNRFGKSQNLDPPPVPSPATKKCPHCGTEYDASLTKCPKGCPSSMTKKTARIKLVSGSLNGKEWILQETRSLTVGRLPNCDIRIPTEETFISGKHCKIELRKDGVYVKDESKNGTFLQNGQRLKLNQWTKIKENFYLVSPDNMFSIEVYNE